MHKVFVIDIRECGYYYMFKKFMFHSVDLKRHSVFLMTKRCKTFHYGILQKFCVGMYF